MKINDMNFPEDIVKSMDTGEYGKISSVCNENNTVSVFVNKEMHVMTKFDFFQKFEPETCDKVCEDVAARLSSNDYLLG